MKSVKPSFIDAQNTTQSDLDWINTYLLVETCEEPCDIALVFGTQDLDTICRMTGKVAKAHARGLFKTIYVSGGPWVKGTHMSEAELLADGLRKQGIPPGDIIVEDAARNTQENVENVRAHYMSREQKASKKQPRPMVFCFGNAYAARRFVMTMLRRWPEALPVFKQVRPGKKGAEKWFLEPGYRAILVQEWNKIAPYLKKKFLQEFSLRALNKEIKARARQNVSRKMPSEKPTQGIKGFKR